MTAPERRAAWLLVGLGAGCVIGGGLASAATALHPTEHTAWAVAYLVLVVALVIAVLGVRGARGAGATRALLYGFRALVVLLLLSIPAGLLLAQFGVG